MHVTSRPGLGEAMATCAGVSSDSDLETIPSSKLSSQRHFDVNAVKRALDVTDTSDEDDALTPEPMSTSGSAVSDKESEVYLS